MFDGTSCEMLAEVPGGFCSRGKRGNKRGWWASQDDDGGQYAAKKAASEWNVVADDSPGPEEEEHPWAMHTLQTQRSGFAGLYWTGPRKTEN